MSTLENQPITVKDENEQKEIIAAEEKSIDLSDVALTKESKDVVVIQPEKLTEGDSLSPLNTVKEPSKTSTRSSIQSKRESMKKKQSNSGIPLAVKGTTNKGKIPAINKSSTRTNTYGNKVVTSNISNTMDKHTIEAQFNNNKKRLVQMQEELIEKQLPLIDLYKNLMNKKKALEKMGKSVTLGELKFTSYNYDKDPIKAAELLEKLTQQNNGSGENSDNELMINLKYSMDNLLSSVMKLYSNFHSKIIESLDTIPKTETETTDTIKEEGSELKKTLELTIHENEKTVMGLINSYLNMINTNHTENEDSTSKITELEETIKRQEQIIVELNKTIDNNSKKIDEKKADQDKTIIELQIKIASLEQDIKKEKKTAYEHSTKNITNVDKLRALKAQITELEIGKKEADDKSKEATNKLKTLQDQIRKKELQWAKEKSEKDLVIQKLTDHKKQLDTRVLDLQENNSKKQEVLTANLESIENELELTQKRLGEVQDEKEDLMKKNTELEQELKKINERNLSVNIVELKQKLGEAEEKIKTQNEQITKMEGSLTAYARLVAVLKVEEDSSVKHVNNLRETLQEAKREIEQKSKALHNLKEKFACKEAAYDELKNKVKKLRSTLPLANDRFFRLQDLIGLKENEHQKPKVMQNAADFQSLYEGCIISSSDECVTHLEALPLQLPKVGKLNYQTHYKPESLIAMSIKQIEYLRTRLNNLNNIQLPIETSQQYNLLENGDNYQLQKNNIRTQIKIKSQLYQKLQKQADECYEDLGNLLKFTISQHSHERQITTSNKFPNSYSVNKLSHQKSEVTTRPPPFSKLNKSIAFMNKYLNFEDQQ